MPGTPLQEIGLSPVLKDWIQILAWAAAIVTGTVAAAKTIRELRESRLLRRDELRWRKAQLAREILKEIRASTLVQHACLMLDWTGREYEITPGHFEAITWDDMDKALRTNNLTFTDKEVHIRDSFDALFDGLEQLEHHLRTNLIALEDIRLPLEYYIAKIAGRKTTMEDFWSAYGYDLAGPFVQRFADNAPQQRRP